jgi:imidazolonepropionase-like amidohydrolase
MSLFDAQPIIELTNGRFVDVRNTSYYPPEVRVIMQENKILCMPGTAGVPGEITPDIRIDLGGRAVIPGLFNTHCHVTGLVSTYFAGIWETLTAKKFEDKQLKKNMADCLERGITNIRDAWAPWLPRIRELRQRIAEGEILGPRITQAVVVNPEGSYLSEKHQREGVGKMMRLLVKLARQKGDDHANDEAGVLEFPVDASPRQVREAVDRAIDNRGAQAIKVVEQYINPAKPETTLAVMTMEQLSALADQARKRGVQSFMHHSTVASLRRGVQAGVSSLSHFQMDGPLEQKDIDAIKASGCVIEPTISAAYAMVWPIKGDSHYGLPDMEKLVNYRNQAYTFGQIAEEFWIPEYRAGVLKTYEKLTRNEFKVVGMDMAPTFKFSANYLDAFDNIRKLYESDVCLALANDSGIPPLTPAMIRLELDMFELLLNMESGEKRFGGADALKISTLNSARSMGLEDEFGSIQTGKIADLAVVEGDPLADPTVIGRKVAALFMDGKLLINHCDLKPEPAGNSK